jgi:ferritin
MKEAVAKVLNEQINAEYYSAYLYLAMSAYADRAGYKGVANWLHVQAQEEMAHAIHIYEYVLDRNESPTFMEVKAPPVEWDGITAVFANVLSHEQHVSELINNIASVAMKENDHATYQFISWYVNEQVEEEATADELLSKVKLMKEESTLLYNLDSELAARTFTNPFTAA